MRKGILQTLKFTAFLAVGVLLLWLAFRSVNFSKLVADLKEADYSWLLLSVFFGFIAFVSRARRWVLLVNPLGYNPSLRNSFYSLMTGYLANLALPRIGEITRCIALGKKENIPVDQLIGTVVIERTIDFISLLSIMITLIFTSGDQIGLFLKESILVPIQQQAGTYFGASWIVWIIILLMAVIILILIIVYREHFRRIRFFSKIFNIAQGSNRRIKNNNQP